MKTRGGKHSEDKGRWMCANLWLVAIRGWIVGGRVGCKRSIMDKSAGEKAIENQLRGG